MPKKPVFMIPGKPSSKQIDEATQMVLAARDEMKAKKAKGSKST